MLLTQAGNGDVLPEFRREERLHFLLSMIGRIGKTTNLKKLRQGFSGRQFRELVKYHLVRSNVDQVALSLQATIRLTGEETLRAGEPIVDEFNIYAHQKDFWGRDCGEVFQEVCGKVSEMLVDKGQPINDQEVFNIFQIIVLNFVKSAHESKEFRRFIGVRKGLFG